MVERWDVAIVGAGPAGCAAALGALRVRPSARVLLIDAAEFPRDKVCGDGIAPHALDVLAGLGVDPAGLVAGCAPIDRLRLCSPRGAVAARTTLRTGFVVPRFVFDERLVRAAVLAGAVLRRQRVRGLLMDDHEVVLDDRTTAGVVIGADGAESVVRRAIEAGQANGGRWTNAVRRLSGVRSTNTVRSTNRDRSWNGVQAGRLGTVMGTVMGTVGTVALAIRGYAPADPWPPGEQILQMTTDNWPAYAWVFPIGDGRANVGYGEILRGTPLSRAHLEQRLRELLPEAEPTELRAHRLPLSTGRARVADGRVLLAGDAASLINPLTGEGIFYAVASGALAGAASVGPDPGPTYERALGERLGRHLRHTDLAATLTRAPRMIDAAVAASSRDQRVFDTLVDLGLGDGLLDARSLLRTARHLTRWM